LSLSLFCLCCSVERETKFLALQPQLGEVTATMHREAPLGSGVSPEAAEVSRLLARREEREFRARVAVARAERNLVTVCSTGRLIVRGQPLGVDLAQEAS